MFNEVKSVDFNLTQPSASNSVSQTAPQKPNSIWTSNPIANKNTMQEEKQTELKKALKNVSDPETRAAIENAFEKGDPSKSFVDYLIQRYEKHKAQFEKAWEEYQLAKDQVKFYKKICQIITKRYESEKDESNYAAGRIEKAEKAYTESLNNADIELSIARDIAHSPFSLG